MKINIIQKIEINRLANLFYRLMGYHVEDSYDFSKATHPAERMVWEQARISHEYWLMLFESRLPKKKGKK